MSTFELATGKSSPQDLEPLALYQWNAQISGAFLPVFHICEVVIRNAISEALELTYGMTWPWDGNFERTLPVPPLGYKPRLDLSRIRTQFHTTGKIIPELKLAFWQDLLNSRQDTRLWRPHLMQVFPHLAGAKSVPQLRDELFQALKKVRLLRNRVAHHEPVLTRDLRADLMNIYWLVGARCPVTLDWLAANQQVTALLETRP